MPDNRELLYNALTEEGLYTKTQQEFNEQFSTPKNQRLLHKALSDQGLYTKGEDEFRMQFFLEDKPLNELLDAQPVEEQPVQEEPQTARDQLAQQVKEQPTAEPKKMGRLESAAAVFNQRFYGLPGDIAKAVAIGGNFIDRYLLGQDVKAEENPVYKAGQWYQDAIKEISPNNPEYQGELQESVAQAMGDLAGLVVGGAAGRMVGKGAQALKGAAPVSEAAQMLPGAAKVAGKPLTTATINASKDVMKGLASPEGLIGAVQMSVSEFEQAIQGGATEDEAFDIFVKNAAVGSLLERIPIQLFWRRLDAVTAGGVKTLLKKGFSGGMEEATTEVLQQAYANKTAKEVYDETRSIIEGMGESGGIGFGLGFVLNAMGVRLRGLKKNAKTPEEVETFQNALHYVEGEIDKVNEQADQVEKQQKDAIKEGKKQKGSEPEYTETEEGGLPPETGDSNIPEQGGEVETEVQPEEEVKPPKEEVLEPPKPTKKVTPEDVKNIEQLLTAPNEDKMSYEQVKRYAVNEVLRGVNDSKLSQEDKDAAEKLFLDNLDQGLRKATDKLESEYDLNVPVGEFGLKFAALEVYANKIKNDPDVGSAVKENIALAPLEQTLGRIPKKADKITGVEDTKGELKVKPIEKKIPKKDIKKALIETTSKDLVRPAMTGIYHDVENQQLVTTDGHILVVIPQKLTGESYIEPTKNSKTEPDVTKIDERFPDYINVIPEDNTHFLNNLDPKEILNVVRGQSKAQKFTDFGNTPTVLDFDDGGSIGFNPELLERAITALASTGTEKINIEASEPGRAAIVRDANNKDKFALVMPIQLAPGDTGEIGMVYTKLSDKPLKINKKIQLQGLKRKLRKWKPENDYMYRAAKDHLENNRKQLKAAKKEGSDRAIEIWTKAITKSQKELDQEQQRLAKEKQDLEKQIADLEQEIEAEKPKPKKPPKKVEKQTKEEKPKPDEKKNENAVEIKKLYDQQEKDLAILEGRLVVEDYEWIPRKELQELQKKKGDVEIETQNLETGEVETESYKPLELQTELRKRHKILQQLSDCVG